MLITFRKIFLFLLILFFSEKTLLFAQSFNQCGEKNFNKSILFEKKKIKLIDIKVKDYRAWQVNNIRILTNNTHVIPDKFKKRFKANIKILFSDNSVCKYKSKIRTQGDLKDHIFYKDGQVFQSLDVGLEDGHLNNITKFKLFLKGTRGIEEDEIFMTELLREFGFLAPRTEIVDVKINDQKIRMLLQEKISKELLEYNKRREGPILEGDEKYMMSFISKVKNDPGVNWSEIFRLSDLGTKVQLSKQTNSSWSIKNNTFTKISLDAIKKLNFIYLVYLNSYKDKKNNYSFLHYNLDNDLLSQNNSKNLDKLNVYNNLLIAGNGQHGLYVHNRKFYWNPIENYFEPIYYDGEFNLTKEVKSLHYPLSLNYEKSIDLTISLINSLDKKKFLKNLKSRNLDLDFEKINKKIDKLKDNLNSIKRIFNEKNKDDLSYNLTSYKKKELFNNYVKNLKLQNIKYRFVKYEYDEKNNNSYIQICEKNLDDCKKKIKLDNVMKRNLLEGKLKIDGYNYQLVKSDISNMEKYNKVILNDENFENVYFFYNNGVKYKYDKTNKRFNIYQTDTTGRSYFLNGKIKDVNIDFSGKKIRYLTQQIVKYDYNNLTGCLSFIKTKFDNTSLSSIYANCEDGINLIDVSGLLKNITASNSVLDGIDLDFSDLMIKRVDIKNSGNDCVDFSSGKYKITHFNLVNCGDKGVSIGEKSKIKIGNIEINKAIIGVASKDSSETFIDNAKIHNTNNCLAAYRKKQEFDGGFIEINNSYCKRYENFVFMDKFSKINIINEL